MIVQESVFLKKKKWNKFPIPHNVHWLKKKKKKKHLKWDEKLMQFIWFKNLMILEKEEERVVHHCLEAFGNAGAGRVCYLSVCILHVQLWFLYINHLLQNMSVYIASTVMMLMSENLIVWFFSFWHVQIFKGISCVSMLYCTEQYLTLQSHKEKKLESALYKWVSTEA